VRRILFLMVSLVFVGRVFAQDPQTGIPPFSSIQSVGVDNVNQQNLNVNFSIPIASSPGRGIAFSFPIANDSLLWQPLSTWTPVVDGGGTPSFGWKTTLPTGTKKLSLSSVACDTPPPVQRADHYQNYSYTDPAGTIHKFNLNFYQFTSPACADTYNTGPRAGYATDGSGYVIDATSPSTPKITTPAGAVITGTSWTDPNGNFFSATVVSGSETDWKDSSGKTPLKIVTSATSIQYEFPDSSGVYQTATLKLTSTSIKTNFACSGKVEYTGTANLPTELDIPTPSGGTLKYLFAYEPTPSHVGFFTGRIQKITLPGGGFYQYDYPGANDSISCADGTTTALNRTVSDGTTSAVWKFVRSGLTTTVTTPQLADTTAANDAVLTYNSLGQLVSQKIYKESPGATLLRTITTTWAANGTPATQITTLEDGSTKAETDTTYESTGLLDSVVEYDWGTGSHGGSAPIRTTAYSYQTNANYTSRNLIGLVTSKVIKDGASAVQFRQDTTYDGVVLTNCPTGVAQHDDTNYPCSMNFRGNPTAVTTYLSPAVPSGGITKNLTYDVFGNVLTAQVNCCQSETWVYSATTNYSQPDSVTRGTSPTQLTTGTTYNAFTGKVSTTTDENNRVTQYGFDFLGRETSVTRSDGTQNTVAYDDVNFKATSTSKVDASHSRVQITAADPLGRLATSTIEDLSSTVYEVVQTGYNLAGRAFKTSNPYTTSPLYWQTTTYDVLGRPTIVTLPDTSKTTYSYTTNSTITSDPANHQRRAITDAAGRLSSVYEPDPSNGNSLTLQTSYAYNVFDQVTQVTQGAQTRTYAYDALTRLNNFTTPEAGNVCLGTLSGATCQSNGYDNWSNLIYRTDARGVVTNYLYDGLNRLAGITYPTVPVGVAAMPNVCKANGAASNNANVCFAYGVTPASFNNGLPLSMTDPSGSESYTYNSLEQITQRQKIVGTTTYNTNYAYNLADEVSQITYPSGHVVVRSYDAIGRLCAVGTSGSTCTTTTAYAYSFGYNTAQQVTGFHYGNNMIASYGYSADRLQLTSLSHGPSGTAYFALGYAYGAAGSNNGLISQITDTPEPGKTITYTYDSLNRLSTAVTNGTTSFPKWGLKWAYDRYGNRTAQTITAGSNVPSNSVSVDPATNRITGTPYAYDASGNMTNDGLNTLTYDGENRAASSVNISSSGTYTYDGSGLRVNKISGSTTTVYIFSGPKVVAEYDNGAAPTAPSREYIYSDTALLARVDATGTEYFHHDHLSNRMVTDSTSHIVEQMAHYPYGESWYNTAADKLLFTSYERDTESGNDYAQARYYVNRLGRFSAVDPFSGSVSDPQSLNRYPYVLNNPISLIDPQGTNCNWDDGTSDDTPIDGGADANTCGQQGGTYTCPAGIICIVADGGPPSPPPDPPEEPSDPIFVIGGYPGGLSGLGGGGPGGGCPASKSTTSLISVSYVVSLRAPAAAVGAELGGPSGAVVGGVLGNMFGVGPSGSWVPSTNSLYAGPAFSFSPFGAQGGNITISSVPAGQSPNSIANGWSSSVTTQPKILGGITVTKSSGSPAVGGWSIGTRSLASVGRSYGICLKGCC
jgi:RHS repeat-associated protein